MNKLLHLNKYVKILLALLCSWMPWLAYPHRGGGHLPTQISVLLNRFLITMQYCFYLYVFLEALISIIFSQNPLKKNKAFLCAIGFKNWTCLCRKSAVFNMAAKLSKSRKVKAVHGNVREKETLKVLKTNFSGVQHFVSGSLFAEGKNILHIPRIRIHSEYSCWWFLFIGNNHGRS